MNTNSLKGKAVSNLLWRFAEKTGAQGVSFVVSIILARLLAPKDYGAIALVTVFTNFLLVFVDSGMGNALIQKKNADDLDFSSVFYFNLMSCIFFYGVMLFLAPFIAGFYGKPELTPVVRVLSLTLVVSGVMNIQQAYVSKTLNFKRFFFATLGGTSGGAALGIAMAYKGYGMWSLVAQQLFCITVSTIILWITVKWRPKKMFSFHRLKDLFSFGWKLLVSALLDTGSNNLQQLIIGKYYTSSALAYYNQGQKIPNLVVVNINSSIDSVLLPVLSLEQDHTEQVKRMTRRAIKVSSYIMWPMMFGICAVAEPLVRLVLTSKWLPAVPYLQLFCLTYALWPIHTANLNAIKAMGRSDMFLKLEVIKTVVSVLSLLILMRFGALAVAFGVMVSSVIGCFINAYPNKDLLGYTYIEQMRDILPAIGLSFLMAAMVYPVSFLRLNDIVTLIIQVGCGAVIYVWGSRLLKLDSFGYLLSSISTLAPKGKKRNEG